MEDLQTLTSALIHWITDLMPDRRRADTLADDLRDLAARLDGPASLNPRLLKKVESVCHRTARHLTLELHDRDGPPDLVVQGWPAISDETVQERSGFVRHVERRRGCGILAIDGLDDARQASPFLHAAFTLLGRSTSFVLDLRHNGGGSMSSLAHVAGFVLGATAQHLVTIRSRTGPAQEWWTPALPTYPCLRPTAPVAVLIGPRTYSSGEALAYHLRARERVHLIGEQTPGAADHVVPVRVTPHVTALIPNGTPVDSVTTSNWEGVGVTPDLPCQADAALDIALDWLAGESDHR